MHKKRDEATVGFFVILALIILTVLIFFVSGVYLFRPGYKVKVVYDYVSILDKGAPVRMAGVRVGEVNSVNLRYDDVSQKTRVYVKLFIEKGMEIRENYQFKIQGTHILSEPHIEITPVVGDAPLIQGGAVIEGITPVAVETLIDRADDIADQLHSILGLVRSAVEDAETSQAFKDIILHWAKLTESLNKVLQGSEGDLKSTVRSLEASSKSISVILDRLEKGEGTAGKLLSEDELYVEMRTFVKEIRERPWRLLKRDNERSKFLGIF